MESFKFLPLVIWAVGFLFCTCYEERTYYNLGWTQEEVREKVDHKSMARLWLLGILFFLVLGVFAT